MSQSPSFNKLNVFWGVPLVAGRWYQSSIHRMTPSAGTTVVVSAGLLYGQPLWVPNPITAISVDVQVTTLAVGSVRLGIYQDSNGQPGALLVDGGAVSTGSTGGKSVVISQVLTPALYWLAALFEATPTMRGYVISNSFMLCLGFSSNSDTTAHQGVEAAQAYGALPDPFPASSLSTGDHPRILVGF